MNLVRPPAHIRTPDAVTAWLGAVDHERPLQLDLRHRIWTAAAIATLAHSPHLVKVSGLALSETKIGDDGLKVLCSSPYLTQLTFLGMEHADITFEGIQALAASPLMRTLQHLRMDGNRVGLVGLLTILSAGPALRVVDASSCAIAPSPGGTTDQAYAMNVNARVEELGLGGNRVTAAVLAAVYRTVSPEYLERLTLQGNGIDDVCMGDIAPLLPTTLRTLDLMMNRIQPGGMEHLVQRPHPNLRSLILDSNPIGDAGFLGLLASKHFQGLEKLAVGRTNVSSRSVNQFVKSPLFLGLRELDLVENEVGDDAIVSACDDRYPNQLDVLSLADTALTDISLVAIGRSRSFLALRDIDLGHNPEVTRNGIRAFLGSEVASRLQRIRLEGYDLAPGDVSEYIVGGKKIYISAMS